MLSIGGVNKQLVVATPARHAVADHLVHPGMFGSVFTEAIVTGVGAALLSYLMSKLIEVVRRRTKASQKATSK